jgi:epoxyqueuosine reductase QueG
MKLESSLLTLAETMGVDFYGVADLALAHDAILQQGGQTIAEFPRAISVGIGLLHPIVDQLPQHEDRAVAMLYRHHAYDLVNQRLDHITSPLASLIQRAGYRVLPIPASQMVDSEQLCGAFSHKMAAHLAGLGWIGRSCMLITPQAGPRVRWASVLTDAPLEATSSPMEQRCGTCRECVDICPVQAYTGEPYRLGEPREVRFAAHKCSKYFDKMKESKGVSVCGLCLYVCPNGRDRVIND